jgi:enolase
MSKEQDIKEVTKMLIEQLHTEITILQKKALDLSTAGDFDACGQVLQKQKEAIGALMATVEAAKLLSGRG